MLGHYILVALRNFRRRPMAVLIRLLVLSLLLVAWASVGLQSWRVARMKPVRVLRHE
jgi:hypothetical protein